MGRNAREELIAGGYLEDVPQNLRPLFSMVPVLQTEDLDSYAMLLLHAIASLQPTRLEEWILVKEHIDLTWDIARLRNIKASMLTAALNEVVIDLSRSEDGTILRHGNLMAVSTATLKDHPVWFREAVDKLGVSSDLVLSQAYYRRAPELERLDRLIAIKDRTREAGLNTFYRAREHYELMRRMDTAGAQPRQLPPPSRREESADEAAEVA